MFNTIVVAFNVHQRFHIVNLIYCIYLHFHEQDYIQYYLLRLILRPFLLFNYSLIILFIFSRGRLPTNTPSTTLLYQRLIAIVGVKFIPPFSSAAASASVDVYDSLSLYLIIIIAIKQEYV